MRTPLQLRLTALALGMAGLSPTWAETPDQVQQRLEQYRQQDEAAAQRRALQAAEAAQQRERTLQWQEQRRREEYVRRWKCYGEVEVDLLQWRQQKDRTWVTAAKVATGSIPCVPGKNANASGRSLSAEPLSYIETNNRVWLKIRTSITLKYLAAALNQDKQRLALLNEVDEDYNFQSGDWLVLLRQSVPRAKMLAEIDTSEVRLTPPLVSPVFTPITSLSPDSLIGINCTALMVNRKPAYQNWGSWTRPSKSSAEEQLVIDRCATPR